MGISNFNDCHNNSRLVEKMKREILNQALADVRTLSTASCGNLKALSELIEQLNNRTNQFIMDFYKQNQSKCMTCCCPDCLRETSKIKFELQHGVKFSGVEDCEHYEERQVS